MVRDPVDPLLEEHLAKARFSVRMLRYWWAAQSIREEAARAGRPLVIVDYGAGRGWLKRFAGADVNARWIALDWRPDERSLRAAGYDEVLECNFDLPLPIGDGEVSVLAALHVFEHLPRPAVSATEIARTLAGGGCLLAASPTMPEPFAGWRHARFRALLGKGRIAKGGHINCLSPGRFRTLLEDCGFDVEFATGSHLVRHTGNPLENSRAWVRMNQAWGAAFPSLGSEVCLRARKPGEGVGAGATWLAEDLRGDVRRPRALAAAAAVLALLGVAGGWGLAREVEESRVEGVLHSQLRLDADHLLVLSHGAFPGVDPHPGISYVSGLHEIDRRFGELPRGTHLVVHESALALLASTDDPYVVDSRIDTGDDAFYILRRDGEGTCLRHFLSQAVAWQRG